jgi:dienelactone hydrolase
MRVALTSEPVQARYEVSIIDVAGGAPRVLPVGPEGLSFPIGWSTDGRRVIALQGGDYSRKVTVFDVDADAGTVRKAYVEDSTTFLQVSPLEYDEPALRYLPRTEELVWYSQRDGWGHLYLLDLRTGRVKAQLGGGDWSVQNIVHLDEARRTLYFTAVGREPGDPYQRRLYAVGLDGRGLKLLTPEAGDHDFPPVMNPAMRDPLEALGMFKEAPIMFSPTGRYFIDSWSTLGQPPEHVVRDAGGRVVMALGKTDAGALLKAGWIAPEPFQATAADRRTAVYGYLIKPAGFDPSRRYPVVEVIYNGPQVVSTSHNFAGTLEDWLAVRAQSFAQLGFVAVVMDGRGTPLRSKAFQDYMYNNMQEFAVEDHVAALRELATRLPFMDFERLGVIGHSFGGFTSMKAILGYPDFYKAAVSSAGPYDMYGMYSLDAFFPPPEFDPVPAPAPAFRAPRNWGAVDLTKQAGQLKGKLLLAYGELDENAYPAVSVRMVDALIAANKEFDLIFMPNRSHAFSDEPYFVRRSWDFFVRNLMDMEPPKDYAFTPRH